MCTYVQQGLANSVSTNDLEGAGFFLRGAYPLGVIGNQVWVDINANGQWNDGEQPVNGVVVDLYFDSNNDGDFVDAGENVPYVSTTTDTQGFYEFTGLQAGRFRVGIPAANFAGGPLAPWPVSSPVTDSADNREDADDNGIQSSPGQPVLGPAIVLTEGEFDRTMDFGFSPRKPGNWIAWQNFNPLGGQNGPNQNPEGDLSENLIEYAFCYDPRNGLPKNPAGNRAFCLRQAGGGVFNAEIIRPTGLTGLTYTLQYAATPGTPTSWTDNDDGTGIVPVIVNNLNGFETVTWQNLESIPALNNGAGYTRIKVTLAAPAATAFTEVQGWLDHDIATQCETYSNPFVKKEVFSGTADAGSPEGELDVTGSSEGVDVSALFTGLDCPYVEIISGPLEGHRFAVDTEGGDADTISLMPGSVFNTMEPFPDLSGAPFVLREPWRFNDLFPAGTFQSGGDVNAADNLLTFDSATQTWTTHFLADLGFFGTYWVDSADAGFPPMNRNNRCLNLNEGIYVHRRGAPLTVPLTGIVRENDFACPLVQGYQLTGGGYPFDQSYAGRGMTLAAGFTGNPDIRSADQVLFWAGDTTVGKVCYQSNYLLDAGAPYQRWVSAEDSFVTALDNDPVFRAGRAAFISRMAPLPGYKVAAPWSP